MQGLVIGGGSIGSRHLQNLRTLGVERLGVVDINADLREALSSGLQVKSFDDLTAGLNWRPDFAVIATPSHLHAEQTLEVVRRTMPVFVEKPLSHTPAALKEISLEVQKSGLVTLVGCNFRFHPGPVQVKTLLNKDRIGRVMFARIQMGSYLPNWRPMQDYRKNYAARHETGGGCILDCIHEIDLARWYLGDVDEVLCLSAKLSSLEIETEDVAALICRHRSGSQSEIHLDYVQRTYERDCQIVGERGSIFWDFKNKQVRWYDALTGEWTTYSDPAGWQLNQMYVDEMGHFLNCVRESRQTVFSVSEAASVMQIAFAAKLSAREGRLVRTETLA